MSGTTPGDAAALRENVRAKYRDVALDPHGPYRFHTGRALAERLGYDDALVAPMPDAAIESFTGVGNPFSLRTLEPGERVIDVGSGAGFDCFVAAGQVGPSGRIVGIDMVEEMIDRSRRSATVMGLGHVAFRHGLIEELPVDDGWADTVISNGAINLCVDKKRIFAEIWRVLRPGGHIQFADIAIAKAGPEPAVGDADLWTA